MPNHAIRDRFSHSSMSETDATEPEPSHEFLVQYWREGKAAQRRNEEEERAAKQCKDQTAKFVKANKEWNGTFMGEAMGFLPTFFPGARIRFEGPDGHIHIVIELQEDCTIENLRDYWYIVSEWRLRLDKWQGPSMKDGRNLLHAGLELSKQLGYSYEELATLLNAKFVDHLAAYLKYEREPAVLRSDGLLAMAEGAEANGNALAAVLLLDMGLIEEDVMTWCTEALQNLRQGKPAFVPDGAPITKEHVRSRLRAWKKKPKGVAKTG